MSGTNAPARLSPTVNRCDFLLTFAEESAPVLRNTSSRCSDVIGIGSDGRAHGSYVAAGDHRSGAARSSVLFESFGPVVVPLSCAEDALARRIIFLKKWYLLLHLVYILLLIFVGSLLFYVIEDNLQFIDAFFIATSCVCCCGLQTVDVAKWTVGSTLLRHLLFSFGGIVVTSSHQPLLRLWMLKKMWPVFEGDSGDSCRERALRTSRRMSAERLWYTSVICFFTPLIYFCLVNVTLMGFLAAFNHSDLSFFKVFQITLSAFHSSTFLPMEQYAEDAAVVLVVTIGCALGFTFFPVVLRDFFYAEWFVYRLARRVGNLVQNALMRRRKSSASVAIVEDALSHQREPLFSGTGELGESGVFLGPWDRGFCDILKSQKPVCFHTFLFVRSETLYLFVVWWVITVVQAVPFWAQQWSGDGLLAPFSTPYKIFISLCQAAVVRFAAASFVTCLQYSDAHVFLTIFCMFLPALPIPTDRTYRKWKQVFRTSIMRLLTSRLFWLFAAVLCILSVEGQRLSERLIGSRFDGTTRTFFEVISAFSGCGMSLSFSNSPISFVGFLGGFSKVVIAFAMIAGRHRTVDLGVDLGFAGLQENQKSTLAGAIRTPRATSAQTTNKS